MPVVSVASLQQQMLLRGVRRVLVFSGEADWCVAQALDFSGQSAGDWLWISDSPPVGVNACSPSAAHSLLGQDFLHGIFDARTGGVFRNT